MESFSEKTKATMNKDVLFILVDSICGLNIWYIKLRSTTTLHKQNESVYIQLFERYFLGIQ